MRTLLAACAACVFAGCVPPTNPFDPATPPERQAAATLVGTVYGPGGPLAGAVVAIDGTALNPLVDGTFEAELVPGLHALDVSHPAHLPQHLEVSVIAGEERILDVVLAPLAIGSEDAGHLFGVVHRSGQLSLPDAEQDHSGIVVEVDGTGVRAVTNLAGAFDLFLAPGSYALTLSSAGHAPVAVEGVAALAGVTTEVPGSPFLLQGIPGSVSGLARLEDGAAPDGIAIDLGGGGSATTDANGAFAIGGVAAGSYPLTATHDGYEPTSVGFVTVAAARDTALLPFVLTLSRGAVHGRVLKAGRQEHAGTVVQLAGVAATVTGDDGSFLIEGVREGSYALTARADGFLTMTVNDVVVVANVDTAVADITLAQQQGDFSINGGAPFTDAPVVTLDLVGLGAVQMRVSEDQTFTDAARGDTAYVPFDQAPTFTLSGQDGVKALFAQLKDGDGVEGPLLSAGITLDTTAPSLSELLINAGAQFTNSATGIVSLSIGATDATSGVTQLQISNTATFSGPFEPFVTARTHTLDDTGNDGPKSVFARVRDAAGNVSSVVESQIVLDRAPPSQSALRIDCDGVDDASTCRSAFVTVHVDSTDAAAIALSNQEGLPNAVFSTFTADTAHLLALGDGARTVYVQLRDFAGNVSAEFSASVVVDATPPTLGTLRIAGGAAAVATHTVEVDAHAVGATQMRLAFDGVIDTEPAVPATFPTQVTGDLPPGDGQKTVAVVFLDDAGNTSEVVSASVIVDETAPSSPSVSINGGAAFTRTETVTVAIGVSGATEMRLRTDGAFDTEQFLPVSATAVVALPGDDCSTADCDQVCAQFRDAAGNVSAVVCDAITLDRTPPTVPLITTPAAVVGNAAFTFALAAEPSDAFFAGYEMLLVPGSGVFEPVVATGGASPQFTAALTADGAYLIRLRAVDEAGNRSAEAALAVTRDTLAPATPVPSIASTIVNADTFAVFFGPTNTSANDVNFARYETAVVSPGRPTKTFSPTALQDGLIFTLEQGNDSTCASPCANQLFIRAVDKAGLVSGEATVVVEEDSTLPTEPRFTPRGARITGLDARMRVEERSLDNGSEAALYEIVGGDIASFTALPAAPFYRFTLDRRDFSHQLCVRGRDLAGNVSTTDCVTIEQQSTQLVAASGVDERNAAIFGDLVAWELQGGSVSAADLRGGAPVLIDSLGVGARFDGDASSIRLAWSSSGAARLASLNPDSPGADLARLRSDPSMCVKRCAPNVGVRSVDLSGQDIIMFGDETGAGGIYRNLVSECRNSLTPCFQAAPTNATRLTNARDLKLCEETGVRVHNGVVVWCEQGTTRELHRLQLTSGVDETIANNLDLPLTGRGEHQPVITSAGIFWGSGASLCRIAAAAAVAVPFTGCPVAQRVSNSISHLWGGDAERIGVSVGVDVLNPVDAAVFDSSTNTLEQLTDDILEQERLEVSRDRVVYSDRQRFSDDIAVRDLTEGTWLVAHPSIQAGPRTDGRFVVWADARQGLQFFGFDLLTETEFAVTPANEIPVVTDQFFGIANGKIAYAIQVAGGATQLYVQDLASGTRQLVSASLGSIRAPELNETATRIVWADSTHTRLQTATLTGLVASAAADVGAVVSEPGRVALSGNVALVEDQGPRNLSCATAGALTSHVIDTEVRGVSAAVVPGVGLVATWGGHNEIRSCVLSCGAVLSCPITVVAGPGGGSVELPKVSASGYITWKANTTSDGLGQVAVFDMLRAARFRIATDYGVDGDAPVFDPYIFGDRVVWSGFAFGSSDIFTAVLRD